MNRFMPRDPVTLQSLADRLGLARSTVCSALRGTGTIAPATRARIVEEARLAGYAPNLQAAALAARRIQGMHRSNLEPVAVLHFPEPGYMGVNSRYNSAMRAHAASLGLDLRLIDLRQHPRPETLARVILARGHRGIIMDRIMMPYDFGNFPWESFSVVSVGRQVADWPFDNVRESMAGTLRQALARVRALGYRRPGICLFHHPGDLADDHSRLGEALCDARLHPAKRPVPTFFDYPGNYPDPAGFEQAVCSWFSRHRPDVVIGFVVSFLYNLRTAGWKLPGDASFLSLLIQPEDPWQRPASGYLDPLGEMTRAALDRMAFLIRHARRGRPETRLEILLPATWHSGETLPPAKI